MNVDTESEVDNNSTSATQDTQTSDPVNTGTPDDGSTDDATSADSDSANADTQTGAANGSLTDRAEQHQQNSQAPSGRDYVPRARFTELQNEINRRTERLKEMERAAQEYQGVKADDVRAWKAAQETAKKSNLPRWSPNHPEHDRFKGLRERYQFAKSLIDRAKPEDREARKAEMASAFHPDELKSLEEWKSHEADFTSRLASDPEGTMAQMMDERIAQAMQQREQAVQHRTEVNASVDGWFDDPRNRAVIKSQKEFMQGALADNIPWAVVRREAEIRHLRSQHQSSQRVAQSAEEKERLLRNGASSTASRDMSTRGQPVGDLYDRAKKIARERGYAPGDARFMNILDELQAQE